ncbi:hypothetical protein PAT3040_00143, partial [Paenibacillus agaridevorans]
RRRYWCRWRYWINGADRANGR